MLELKINSHVTRMNRHLPFTTSGDQIFEEYQKDTDTLDIETRAQSYLLHAVESCAQLIILTGDAGHGKTHLCRRLLEKHFSYSPSKARELLLNCCDGTMKIKDENSVPNKKSLRIHKDLSELEISEATKFIDGITLDDDSVTIICANEGRLRAVISQGSSDISTGIRDVFAGSFDTGLCTLDGRLHIINLNFQSVAGTEGERKSILGSAIKKWAEDGGKWRFSLVSRSGTSLPLDKLNSFLRRWSTALLRLNGKPGGRLILFFCSSQKHKEHSRNRSTLDRERRIILFYRVI